MAEIKLTVPDGSITRIINAFAGEFGYQAQVDDGAGNLIPNPQTKAQFTKAKVTEYVKQVTRNYEGNIAAGVARQEKVIEIDGISIT